MADNDKFKNIKVNKCYNEENGKIALVLNLSDAEKKQLYYSTNLVVIEAKTKIRKN